MKKVILLLIIITTFTSTMFSQVSTGTSGRVNAINTNFAFNITDGQYNRTLIKSGWLTGIGDYLSIKHGGGNSEANTYGMRISDHYGFDIGKNDFVSSLFKIKTNGYVGIGTSNPSEELEVFGNGASIKLNASNASTLYNLKFTSNYDYSNKFTMQSGDAVVMQEKSIVDVGGSGNTNSKLFLSNYYGVGFSSSSNPTNNSDIDFYIAGHGNSVSLGNVGIGTTSPDSKLSVNGNIHTKEVKVDLIGWSDFVFNNDYSLPTLKEVEQHIKEKGHPKNIPTAQEVAEHGILLGEMNAKLLEKIEELTLYTINQEKRIESLEAKNKKLIIIVEKLLKTKIEE